jgi:hypothetical protein
MRYTSQRAALPALLVLLTACSAARPLRPLPPGSLALEVSVPGVWIQNERTFPVGLPVVGARYGVRESVEATFRWYAPLAAAGIGGGEVGGVWHVFPGASGWIPGLHLTSELSLLVAPSHFREAFTHGVRGATAVDLLAHWEPWARLWPYIAVQYGVILADGRIVGSGYGGLQLRVTDRWDVSFETGVAAATERTREYSQPYLGMGGRGVLWMSWCATYRLDGGKP